jgi:hypothetical protein
MSRDIFAGIHRNFVHLIYEETKSWILYDDHRYHIISTMYLLHLFYSTSYIFNSKEVLKHFPL